MRYYNLLFLRRTAKLIFFLFSLTELNGILRRCFSFHARCCTQSSPVLRTIPLCMRPMFVIHLELLPCLPHPFAILVTKQFQQLTYSLITLWFASRSHAFNIINQIIPVIRRNELPHIALEFLLQQTQFALLKSMQQQTHLLQIQAFERQHVLIVEY